MNHVFDPDVCTNPTQTVDRWDHIHYHLLLWVVCWGCWGIHLVLSFYLLIYSHQLWYLQNSLLFKSSYDLILGPFIFVMFFASWLALGEEMKLDMQRIWKRNLGRDDRCISDNGKEVWLYNFSWVILMCCNCMDSCSTFRPDSHS